MKSAGGTNIAENSKPIALPQEETKRGPVGKLQFSISRLELEVMTEKEQTQTNAKE